MVQADLKFVASTRTWLFFFSSSSSAGADFFNLQTHRLLPKRSKQRVEAWSSALHATQRRPEIVGEAGGASSVPPFI